MARRVEVVERAGDQQIGVGVEGLAELVALVAQVAFDLEFHVLRRVPVGRCRRGERRQAARKREGLLGGQRTTRSGERGGLKLTPELLVHHVVAEVGDVADHARDAQAPLGHHALGVEVAAVKIRVGDDGAACDLVEGDVLGRQVRRAGYHQGMFDALGVLQRPAQRLHAAQAATHHGGQRLNAQVVDHTHLRVHPVFHRDNRKIGAIDAPGVRVQVHGPGRAKAGTEVVDADDEEAVGVQRLARADHVVPPAFALGLTFIDAGHMVRGVQCMADQHRVGLVGVELAVGLVGQGVAANRCAALQRQRLVEGEELRRDKHKKTRRRQKRSRVQQ